MKRSSVYKFQQQINAFHGNFKRHVLENRPNVDINKVATGEIWYGEEAKGKGLVDEISTSEEYLMKKMETHDVIKVSPYQEKKAGLFGRALHPSDVSLNHRVRGLVKSVIKGGLDLFAECLEETGEVEMMIEDEQIGMMHMSESLPARDTTTVRPSASNFWGWSSFLW